MELTERTLATAEHLGTELSSKVLECAKGDRQFDVAMDVLERGKVAKYKQRIPSYGPRYGQWATVYGDKCADSDSFNNLLVRLEKQVGLQFRFQKFNREERISNELIALGHVLFFVPADTHHQNRLLPGRGYEVRNLKTHYIVDAYGIRKEEP